MTAEEAAPSPAFLTVDSPAAAAATDFDLDGRPDLAVLNRESAILFRNGFPGAFERAAEFRAGLSPCSLLAEDIDADGLPDLVVGNLGSTSLSIGYGRGDGSFEPTAEVAVEVAPRALATGDFDANGLPDLVLGGGDRGGVVVLLQVSRRSFSHHVLTAAVPYPHVLVAGNFNDDEHLDFAVWGRGDLPPHLAIFEGAGDGTFKSVTVPNEFLDPSWGVLGATRVDLNGDGLDELLTFQADALGGDELTSFFLVVEAGGEEGSYKTRQWGPRLGVAESSCLLALESKTGSLQDAVVIGNRRDQGVLAIVDNSEGAAEAEAPCWLRLSGAVNQFVVSGALADFNGDGKVDAAVALPNEMAVQVLYSILEQCRPDESKCFAPEESLASGIPGPLLLQAGDFVAQAPGQEVLAAGSGTALVLSWQAGRLQELRRFDAPLAVKGAACGDLDGAGSEDLAMTDLAGGKVRLVYFAADGQPEAASLALSGASLPVGVVAADCDGDGLKDIVAALSGEDRIAVFRGRGQREFDPPVYFEAGSRPQDVAAGDIDGDGRVDVVVTNPSAQRVSVLKGTGSGAPGQLLGGPEALTVLEDPRALEIWDADGNGRDDILVAHSSAGWVLLLRSFEDRMRTTLFPVPSAARLTDLVVGQLDGDGILDFAVSDAGARTVEIFKGDERGMFEPSDMLQLPDFGAESELALCAVDLDLDGRQDLVAGGGADAVLWPFRATGCEEGERFRRGDVDASGGVAITDAILVLAHLFWGGGPLACEDAADADDDGHIVLTDAVAILSLLFRGGAPLAPPGPSACGEDPREDELQACEGECR